MRHFGTACAHFDVLRCPKPLVDQILYLAIGITARRKKWYSFSPRARPPYTTATDGNAKVALAVID